MGKMGRFTDMPVRVRFLGSSSSGNCALLETGQTRILVDCGLSGRTVVRLLGGVGLRPEDLDAVFLTHEHSDHSQGVRGLSKHDNLTYFATADTARAVQGGLSRQVSWTLFESGRPFRFRDLEVHPFPIPHDAYDPVGFVFSVGEGRDLFDMRRTLAWMTDLGHVPPGVRELVLRADVLVIESNYEDELLEQDVRRSWNVKQRIRSRHGHLSNEDAIAFLAQNRTAANWSQVFLGHLSRDCNCPVRLRERLAEAGLWGVPGLGIEILQPLAEGCMCSWEG